MVRGRKKRRKDLFYELQTGVIVNMSVIEERDTRNIYEHLRIKVEVLIEQVETTVGTPPVSVPALKLRVESAREAWEEFGLQYVKLRNATGDKRVADQVRGSDDHAQHTDLQRHYYAAIALADTALIEDEQRRQDEEKSEADRRELLAQQEEARRKEAKVAQLTAKLKTAYNHFEKKLDKIKAGLDAEVITCMEVLDVRISRLHQVEGLFRRVKKPRTFDHRGGSY